MATPLKLETLRAQLLQKGYLVRNQTISNEESPQYVTVHFHPLFLKPVALIGADSSDSLAYQEQLVREALKRR